MVFKTGDFDVMTAESKNETTLRKDFHNLYKNCPIPEEELFNNLPLFIRRQNFARIFFLHELYQKIINIHGVVMEFGVRWGNNLALFETFRGIYEPYNWPRKIIGFDTFSGFTSVHKNDRNESISKGSYSVTEGYEDYLEKILNYHENESPISHIKKYELVKGDASITVKKYLEDNPETMIAFAYFDLDLYEPTKKVLELILPHLTKGSVIGFDQLNHHNFPGETIAFKEVVGLQKTKILRSPIVPHHSYLIWE